MSLPQASERRPWRVLGPLILAASALLCGACLDLPPEYQASERGPPFLESSAAEPPTTAVRLVDAQEQAILFSIPFRADDLGSSLEAIFWLDYDPLVRDFRKFIGAVPVASSALPFEEQDGRAVSLTWALALEPPPLNPDPTRVASIRPLPGCHTVTMILTYDDNITGNIAILDTALAATETWWFEFDDGDPNTPRVACPSGLGQ